VVFKKPGGVGYCCFMNAGTGGGGSRPALPPDSSILPTPMAPPSSGATHWKTWQSDLDIPQRKTLIQHMCVAPHPRVVSLPSPPPHKKNAALSFLPVFACRSKITIGGGPRLSRRTDPWPYSPPPPRRTSLRLFQQRKPSETKEWRQKLPDFVLRLEEAVYRGARTKVRCTRGNVFNYLTHERCRPSFQTKLTP